ncbi:glutamine and serine-rich protein 1 isoform X2 [Betta splendens]|uniref:Glutamine and serine-rich protein 1 isoform X2 n=1 Tax=Betta splendens TaxID=158456 RepID=A0A6P7LX96_BETSP|nr:glutamine and serine-rich protein 1 isoform X2 [Betta splendens]
MMDRAEPTSSFADALAPPAQTVASWAYDRSAASIKPSSSYGAAHLDAELLQRQCYTPTHQLPTYTTSHLPAAPGTLATSSNTSETSIMSFLSAMETRSLQAGPVSASLLPPFRPPSWSAGTNSTTELYLTGALPSTATFPSPASLSSYQHTSAYPPRSYAGNSSPALQDPAFSTSTNGLFPHHDQLLHLKSTQTVLPTALAFNHLSAPAFASALPVQSSTYRSAQESAPHLLQPQFSLMSSAVPASHGAPQPYGATVFSSSIERALQRECSVIKHHQRPSSSHTVSEQLPNSEHSLQEYFGSGSDADVTYQQDPSLQTSVTGSHSTGADSSQGVNHGAPQPKIDSVTEAYSSTSVPKTKDCSNLALHQAGVDKNHNHSPPERYSSPEQNQSSVIADQKSVQLHDLSNSLSQASPPDKIPPIYTTLPSLSSQSGSVVSASHTPGYASSPGLSHEQEVHYGAQVQGLCQGNLSESYSTSHSQGASDVTFASHSQGQASGTRTQSYSVGQSLNSSYATTCVQSLPSTNSTQDYTLMQVSVGGKTHGTLSQQQTQVNKYNMSASLPPYTSSAQALQNNIGSPVQDIQTLQPSSAVGNNVTAHNNVIYVVSKMDDRQKPQSVIRSNSRSDDQLMGMDQSNTAQVNDDRMGCLSQQHIDLSSANGQGTTNTKTTDSSIVSSHVPLSSEQLNQHPLQLKTPESHQQNHPNHNQPRPQSSAAHTQYITAPGAQLLLDANQMIVLQQPIVHHGPNPSKLVSVQGIQPTQNLGPHVQYVHMNQELQGPTEAQSQQRTTVSEQSSGCPDSSKQHYSQSTNQQSNDYKNLLMPSLLSSSLSQTYITPHTQPEPTSSPPNKMPPIYTTLPSLSSQSGSVVSASQTPGYSSSPGLSHEQEVHYGAQVQGLCQGNLSESYSTSHSQGASDVTFASHSQGQASGTRTQSYSVGQSLNSSYATTCVQSLPSTNSTQDYTLMQVSVGGKTHGTLSQQQTQVNKYNMSASLPPYTSSAQALQNNSRSSVQDIQTLQPSSAVGNNVTVIYVVSKMDDHQKPQSVIRSNSLSDDQLMGMDQSNTAQVNNDRMGCLSQQHIDLSSANGQGTTNTKTTDSSIVSSHVPLSSEQLNQHLLQLKTSESHQQNHPNHNQPRPQSSAAHTQYITAPGAQLLLDANQMIVLQQPIVHHSSNPSKLLSVQGIQPTQNLGPHVQYVHMNQELLGPTKAQSQQRLTVSEQSSGCPDSSKQHYSQSTNQQSNDSKNLLMPSLLSSSLSQTYITPRTQPQPPSPSSNKHPHLYTTLPSLSSQSGSVVSASQTPGYSSSPGLSHEQEVHYGAQVQGLCQGNLSGSYSTSHSQGASDVTFASHSQGQASGTRTQSYSVGQSLNSSYATTCVQSLPSTNSTQDYTFMQASVGGKTHGTLSQQQTQVNKYNMSASLPPYTSSAQALQNNIGSPVQDIQTLQPSSAVGNNVTAHNNVIYVVSKMDDRQKPQSVIRSNSRSDDQLMGMDQSNTAQVNDDRMGCLSQQHIDLSSANGQGTTNTKTTDSSIVSSHVPLSSEQLNQHPLQLKTPESHQQNHPNHNQPRPQSSAAHTQYITAPGAQLLLDANQMIVLQQPIVHHGPNPSKLVSVQGIQPTQNLGPHVQYVHMNQEMLGQQRTTVSEQSSGCSDSSKQHYSQSVNQQSNVAKNHFALNSICFPDSMLLADDRNILSNVDDILAATVAACGVAPQDFVNATSSAEAEMVVMAGPVDSKGHFHTVDIRHVSPSFSSAQQQIITNTNSHTIGMTLNGAQMTPDCASRSVHHSNSSELDSNGDGGSENDHHIPGQMYDPSPLHNTVKGNDKCNKTRDGMESPGGEDFLKKKSRSKSLTKSGGSEEDSVQSRAAKRSGQGKRQNSRGGDVVSPSASNGVYDVCPQQERMRQRIREVEEKQPEVKTGFIGSFLDFIKSGPKQQYSPSPTRTTSRPRKACVSTKPPTCTVPALASRLHTLQGQLPIPPESQRASSQQKRLDEDLQKNLETLPSFSSDEEESTGKNQALRNSITSVLSALDESSDRKARTDAQISSSNVKPAQVTTATHTVSETCAPQVAIPTQTTNAAPGGAGFAAREEPKETPPGQLAVQLMSVAIEGLTDEELSDSGGEGMYRERDEFVVRNEDIENLKGTMRTGSEPPAIWKVQKALLQKFVPELRDGKRVFSATNSYLGYFGDVKTMYQRVYVKFLDTVNKREYVRVCSRKPRCKPMNSLRGVQVKSFLGLTATSSQSQRLRPKQPKPRAEAPPKKRRKWEEEFSSTASGSSAEEELNPLVPFASRFLNTRTMKEAFKCFVELLISIALDEDVMTALERANDELLLPNMKRVDGMITDNRKRLLHKLHIGQVLKMALDSFPEISVVTELKKDGETPAFKVRLSGKAYNKKTMKPYKMPNKVPQEYTVDQQKTQWFSLYHSLQHYKYHTYLMCKDEIASLRVQAGELAQEEIVQKCLQNGAWVEGLFDRFGELINQVQQACR